MSLMNLWHAGLPERWLRKPWWLGVVTAVLGLS
jgi:hypothetical protein